MSDVAATIARWRELTASADPGGSSRTVLIAASFTANPIAPALGVALADATGAVPAVRFVDYNQIFQLCVDPAAHGAEEADDVVIVWRLEDVFERDFHHWCCHEVDARERLLDSVQELGAAIAGLAASSSVVVADCPTPIGYGLDHDDPELVSSLLAIQREANAALDAGLGDTAVDRVRLAALQHAAGTVASFDRRTWLMYRQPFTVGFAHRVGAEIAAVIGARTRVPPKAIVLDCDGTLWDGIAADGIGGLDCSDAFPGFAFRSFQFAAQRLRHQGVVLAIASKNDPDTVTQAFAELDGMVLTDDDITVRRVSWDPKPPAVAEIIATLNIGHDAVVFVDDSEYEVGAMRVQLPQVRTLQVPADIEALPDLLAETGWFRRMVVTADDRERTQRMVAEAGRAAVATTMSHDEFLASLDLHVVVEHASSSDVGRVTQLINKTNQFNVTTKRRSEHEVAALLDDPEARLFTVAVHDRFGEYGTVGVVIALATNSGWQFDTVLMSCRVLGRGVESAMLAGIAASLRAERAAPITASFVASGRNDLVADLFPAHGFLPAGTCCWELPVDGPLPAPAHVTLTHP